MNKKAYVGVLIIIFVASLLVMIISFSPKIQTVNADNSSAKAMCVIESNTKRVLKQKECNNQLAMASTTKVMTALIALENCKDLDEVFDIDNRASGIEGTSIYLQKNEKLSMRELLYGLMLASGNDAACAIAYKIGNGNIQTFVDLMNDKCEELGLKNTHFDNPHGLDSDTHYTSAYDLCVITSVAMKNEVFREIVSTKVKQISGNDKVESRFVRNKHKLVGKMEGCNGVKTGFTDNARRCCVTSVERNGMQLICVVLNCQDMFEESEKQLESAFNEYSNTCLVEKFQTINEILVEDGVEDKVATYVKEEICYPLTADELKKVRIEYDIKEQLNAPVEKDCIVGKQNVFLSDELIASQDVFAIKEIKEKNVGDKIHDIIDKWYLGNA